MKKIAYRFDPAGYVARLARAESERHVSVRPAPETMARLTALLPVAQGVAAYAAYAALRREADTLRAADDPRGRGQFMADTLVQRLTGQATAEGVPVEINLIMTDTALFGTDDQPASEAGPAVQADPTEQADSEDTTSAAASAEQGASRGEEPAHLVGFGPIPAFLARRLAGNPDSAVCRWLRRVYTRPQDGQLPTMETHRRLFTASQAHFLTLRDQICRTPYCGAPIRHADHINPHDTGGATAISNGHGLCEACNHARQADGWHAVTDGDTITIRTPTGHAYTSRPPAPPGVAA